MVITPNSKIVLLKCPLKLDNLNQITFASASDQYSYFNSLTKLSIDDATYQRKEGVIRFPTHTELNDGYPTYEDLLEYNYCMYQNTSYDEKWFYAFITDYKYINDGLTTISIETDAFQTWQFDLVYKQSFIEREHVSDDTVGKHTITENLPTGEIISCDLQPSYNGTFTDYCAVLCVSELITSTGSYSRHNQLIPSGLYFIGIADNGDLLTYCKAYDKAGKASAINSVFVAPKDFFKTFTTNTSVTAGGETFTFTGGISYDVYYDYTTTFTVSKVSYLADQYYPRNKKLLTYPYSYLQASNHNGSIVNYKWELFNMLVPSGTTPPTDITFNLKGVLSPGCSFSCYPANYKNILGNVDENINLGKYPIGGWNSDVYTNWLTQNGINLFGHQFTATEARVGSAALLGGTGLIDAVKGSKTGDVDKTAGGIGDISSGIIGIYNALQDDYRHSLIPDQANGNTNIGDYSFQFGLTCLEFKRMSIKREYAVMLDSYFDLYGYKVNRVGTPNIHQRTYWDYIKTIGVNLEGDIPEKDLNKIRGMFNNGCTFWHTTTYFLDYSQSNTILSS